MFSRHLGSSSSGNRTKVVLTKSSVVRYPAGNDTDSEEGGFYVKESRIVRWRRESINGNANLIIAG